MLSHLVKGQTFGMTMFWLILGEYDSFLARLLSKIVGAGREIWIYGHQDCV